MKVRLFLGVLSGLLTWWMLSRVMDRPAESAEAAVHRQWVVIGMLLLGGIVVLGNRRGEGEQLASQTSPEVIAARYRRYGLVGWVFVATGSLMAIRLIWRIG